MPIYPNEVCPVCGKNPNITYICEDCNEIFCEDCVDLHGEDNLACLQCGGSDIHYDKHGRSFCRDCGSHDMRNVKNINPTCRICESENVVLITEKQKQLIEDFKTIIKDTRAFIKPLEEMVERLTIYRHNLYQLRKEYPPCYHYPTLEEDAIINFKLFDKAKSTLYEHVNRFFQEIQHNINYIAEIQVTHPSNLPYISEILKHFERERKKVTNLSINNVEIIDKRISPDEEKVEFMGAMQGFFTSFIGKLQLERDEKIVFALKCRLSTGTSKKKDYSNKNGTILITNKRLYFYHEQGVFQKRTVELFSVKLSDLQQAGVKGRLKKKVSLEFLNSMYQFSISKDNREELINWIEKARKFGSNNKHNEDGIKNLAKYKLNTKLFREDLENTIYELIGYHGSYVDNPNSYQNGQTIHPSMYRRKGFKRPQSNREQESRFKPMNFQNNLQQQPEINTQQDRYGSFSNRYEEPKQNLMTPAGHYGYPHDHTSSSLKSRNFNQNSPNPVRHSNSYQSNEFTSQNGPIDFGSQSHFGQVPHSNPQNFNNNVDDYKYRNQSVTTPAYPSNMNNFYKQHNEEMNLRKQVDKLRQEDYALSQTITMLEQRSDKGMINNIEFVKSYKQLQVEKYVIQDKINEIEKFLSEKNSMRNN
ncbi:PH domain-containing protein [Promethearchaeum syntrophicum]|uniref:PH domain-containing protein n=1 Tax=Promethearchaeum syntrophicum TaxID=2594042 RepID=A0A5B9DBP0_9ARCH|nr:PH domain-containing protein [Candidatus Prometheoarchaeum syntrophicum]QEE16267.1 hypothetical protein DSAG12_02097 [Candidatus Prometheoarchaeum syntrophicum]